jgi:5-(hydroxymethyl)furfural/furfural oxidase
MDYDYLIVGGGSAGCVLASRLSERAANRVLLVEAGRDVSAATMEPELSDSYPGTAYINPANLWPGLTIRSTTRGGHNRPDAATRRPYAQARILGGGSTINGQMANWGVPSDYDEWEELGAAGWGWEDVFPFFRKLETDLDYPGPGHGSDGPMAVRRIPLEQWSEHQRAIARSLSGMGFAALKDQNGDFGDGWFPLVHNNRGEARVSAATAYLDEAVRRRPNLRIVTDTQVVGLTFGGRRCVGARLRNSAGETGVSARTVVLSAGAVHSPAMLLRAGIGPSDQLKALDIPVVHALPGVGRGLMDHPQIAIGAYLKRHARLNGETGRHVHMGLRYTSSIPDAPQGDMFMGAVSRTAWHAVGRQLGAVTVWVNKTFSRDGEVRLVSRDWRVAPDVDFRLLSDGRDLERLKEGFRLMAKVQMSEALREVCDLPFPASYTDRARQVGAYSTKNRLLTGAMAAMLEGPAALRGALMRRFILSRHDLQDCLREEAALEDFIYESVAGIWHASCSCRMGGADDRMAVTDNRGRVRGVDGLMVCDTSVFPSVPSANTNFPAMMVAEKIAASTLAA